MKYDAPMSFWLRIRWMVRMWILLVATCLAPLAGFAYDEQNQTTVAYDTSGECAVGYETPSVLATGEKINGANRDRFPFAEFARFLAANTGAPLFRAVTGAELNSIKQTKKGFAHSIVRFGAIRGDPLLLDLAVNAW